MPNLLKCPIYHWGRCFACWSAVFFVCQGPFAVAGVTVRETGSSAFQRGGFTEAAAFWRQSAAAFHNQRDTNAQVTALVNLSAAYQALGRHPRAVATLL